jgi:hypothetical protein
MNRDNIRPANPLRLKSKLPGGLVTRAAQDAILLHQSIHLKSDGEYVTTTYFFDQFISPSLLGAGDFRDHRAHCRPERQRGARR